MSHNCRSGIKRKITDRRYIVRIFFVSLLFCVVERFCLLDVTRVTLRDTSWHFVARCSWWLRRRFVRSRGALVGEIKTLRVVSPQMCLRLTLKSLPIHRRRRISAVLDS
jgi:hypothetical protein